MNAASIVPDSSPSVGKVFAGFSVAGVVLLGTAFFAAHMNKKTRVSYKPTRWSKNRRRR
jgi:hypothetical protein